jgi:hypothetical protein
MMVSRIVPLAGTLVLAACMTAEERAAAVAAEDHATCLRSAARHDAAGFRGAYRECRLRLARERE